jgi:hypothetical protein
LTVRIVYHLALRQTEGFLRSLASQLELDLPIPDHTTLSRRARKLGKIRFAPVASSRSIHILIDSTGLKIHVGNLRKPPKHRDWRKLHVAVNSKSGHVVALELTSKAARDCARVPAWHWCSALLGTSRALSGPVWSSLQCGAGVAE